MAKSDRILLLDTLKLIRKEALIMPQNFTPEFKKKIARLHVEEGRKGNRLEAYRFIDQYSEEFGIRWLLSRLEIYPDAYYNYRKHRKADYYTQKSGGMEQTRDIYHSHNGVDGYRSMTYLAHRGYDYSPVISLYDRSVVASITNCHITCDLAVRTLRKALDLQPAVKGELLLHSDQGSQYTSKPDS